MSERLKMSRQTIVNEMDALYENGLISEEISKLYSVIFGTATIFLPPEQTLSLNARQYACSKNAIYNIFKKRSVDAWWEIYDFVTAGEEETLSLSEMITLSQLLEFYCSVLFNMEI